MRSPGKPLSAIVLLALAPLSSFAGELPTAAALLERSIGYHDPEGTWGRKAHTLALDESRPGNRFVKDGVLISLERPALAIDPADDFTFVGRHRFTIRDVAAGERFVFVEASGETVKRLFLVQFEAFLPGTDNYYRYDLGRSPIVAGYPFRSNGFAFDLSEARATDPGDEAATTATFLEDRGYVLPDQWMMWRSLTVTDPARKSEVILFYVENVAAAGLMLDDLYANGTDTEVWTELQVALERRANQSFVLTALGADNEPIDGGWTSIPNRPSE